MVSSWGVLAQHGPAVPTAQAAPGPAIRRPILIIPGILGSLPTSGGLKQYFTNVTEGFWDPSYKTPLVLDPVRHTYDGLINGLVASGYEKDKTLFVFPYNWMQDNNVSAQQLAQKLRDIRQQCGCSKVDIVAHSMGGLVAEAYIVSDSYQNDVFNFVALATPHHGAVAAYAAWEAGEVGLIPATSSPVLGAVFKVLGGTTAAKRTAFIRTQVPSLAQLLPDNMYISGRLYPNGYPRNLFLENLAYQYQIGRLYERSRYYSLASVAVPTLTSLVVDTPQPGALLWPHGRILSRHDSMGDGTVGVTSARARSGVYEGRYNSSFIDTDHHGIVSLAPFYVMQWVADWTPPSGSFGAGEEASIAVAVEGLASLEIYDAAGHKVDDNELMISNAFYTGSQVSPQFAILPATGSYTVKAQAQAAGLITIRVATEAFDEVAEVQQELQTGETAVFHYDNEHAELQPGEKADSPPVADRTLPASPLSGDPPRGAVPTASSVVRNTLDAWIRRGELYRNQHQRHLSHQATRSSGRSESSLPSWMCPVTAAIVIAAPWLTKTGRAVLGKTLNRVLSAGRRRRYEDRGR